MSDLAFGIVNFTENQVWVEGLHEYRPISAFPYLGRYRMVDFPISNMSNSDISHIDVYCNASPAALVEHVGSGRHYNINSKSGKLRMRFANNQRDHDMFSTDIAAFRDNIIDIEMINEPYVVIAPANMVFAQDYDAVINEHINSGADITLLYHNVDDAKEKYALCHCLNLNKQKGVEAIERNRGNVKNRSIFMNSYVMKKELFVDLIKKATKTSTMYTLVDIVNASLPDLDVRGYAHRGFFAAVTDLQSYVDANFALLDYSVAKNLFTDKWPIYTRTNDSPPTRYYKDACVKESVVSNGCRLQGTVENSVIGRGVEVGEGAVVKNCVILNDVVIGDGVYCENLVVDGNAKLTKVKEVVGVNGKPQYVAKFDVI